MPFIKNKTIQSLSENDIFVFGSNLAGIHGVGAAQAARVYFGAQYGIGEGLTGKCYALPTKDENLNVRSLEDIYNSILKLKVIANENQNKTFYLTRIGQGYAGYTEDQIKPLVISSDLPPNIIPWWIWESAT
jgi:hypothetical protein